ncbi:hypothetical protein SAY86_027499 [Trapa natans]|uniref:Polygalacturonase n=1 Tax=Trapa natans TaxID=22666 RepID=A0AAN7KQX9_TRANT|nr:hypothetical protein SAY86_027499 [Trapa natans]
MDSRHLCMSFFILFFLVLANEAFQDAFANSCNVTGGRSQIVVPRGAYMVKSAVFNGPCKGWIEFRVEGTIKAPAGLVSDDDWVAFRHFDGLAITGKGTFHGFGESAWNFNNCEKNPKCRRLPISIQLDFVNNSVVSGINSLNSKYFHVKIHQSHRIKIDGVHIIAPEDSPNTDGIHIGNSENIRILNSIIATGDDCVSMGPGSKDIWVHNVTCGPGHGISIGSLGKYDNEADVNGIKVQNCTLSGTNYGLRIKTWASDIQLSAYNITYDNVIIDNAYNPIFIDQQYCPFDGCDQSAKPSSVQIKDVWFKNIRGSSKSQLAVTLQCSRKYPCNNINFWNINLLYHGPEGSVNATCMNVRGSASGIEKPASCI